MDLSFVYDNPNPLEFLQERMYWLFLPRLYAVRPNKMHGAERELCANEMPVVFDGEAAAPRAPSPRTLYPLPNQPPPA